MKEFNLEEALAGKPVITRAGKKVLEIMEFKQNITFPVLAIIEGKNSAESYTKEGKFLTYDVSHFDLYMATEKKTMWMAKNKYESEPGRIRTSALFDDKEKLGELIFFDPEKENWIIIPVEIEV